MSNITIFQPRDGGLFVLLADLLFDYDLANLANTCNLFKQATLPKFMFHVKRMKKWINGLPNVRTLHTYSKFIDLDLIIPCSKLTTLDLGHSITTDLTPLKHLEQLTDLDISWHDRADIDLTPIGDLIKLRSLQMWSTNNSGFLWVQNLVNLEYLDISNNRLTTLDFLYPLKKLKSLIIWSCAVTNIKPLVSLTSLTRLDISYNPLIVDVLDIWKLVNLEYLNISHCKLNIVDWIFRLVKLKVLDLSNNNIRGVSGLRFLTNLQVVYLSGNKIKSITCLGKLPKLKKISICGTYVKSVSCLQSLPKLQEVRLIKDRTPDWEILTPRVKVFG